VKALQDGEGAFVGAGQLLELRADAGPAAVAVEQRLGCRAVVTAVAVPAAFVFAYALTRSRMPARPLFRGITLVPLLAPTLLSAISLIYWFGKQACSRSCCRRWASPSLRRAGIVLARSSPSSRMR
jgi:iron(III) transport system permease protein